MNLLQDSTNKGLEVNAHTQLPQKRRTSLLKARSKVVLKTSTYPNKRNVAYAIIRSTDPTTKAGGIGLGVKLSLVRIDEPILENEELLREVCDCKAIGDAFLEGLLISWSLVFLMLNFFFQIPESQGYI